MQKFVCPVCGWTIKEPFTQKGIIEQIRQHPEDKTLPDKVSKIVAHFRLRYSSAVCGNVPEPTLLLRSAVIFRNLTDLKNYA